MDFEHPTQGGGLHPCKQLGTNIFTDAKIHTWPIKTTIRLCFIVHMEVKVQVTSDQ